MWWFYSNFYYFIGHFKIINHRETIIFRFLPTDSIFLQTDGIRIQLPEKNEKWKMKMVLDSLPIHILILIFLSVYFFIFGWHSNQKALFKIGPECVSSSTANTEIMNIWFFGWYFINNFFQRLTYNLAIISTWIVFYLEAFYHFYISCVTNVISLDADIRYTIQHFAYIFQPL